MMNETLNQSHGEFQIDDDSRTIVDPGMGLLLTSLIAIVFLVGCALPLAISFHRKWRKNSEIAYDAVLSVEKGEQKLSENNEDESEEEVEISIKTVARFDEENSKILSYTIPFTFSSLSNSIFDSVYIAIISHYIGINEGIAYAVFHLIFGTVEEILNGFFDAIPIVCGNAIGAKSFNLAGQYVQLAIILYFLGAIPVFAFFFFYTKESILWLEWGNEDIANHAQTFAKINIWNSLIHGISYGFELLLDTTEHATFTAGLDFSMGILCITTLLLIVFLSSEELTLELTAYVFIFFSTLHLFLMLLVGYYKNWLTPFINGLLKRNSLKNKRAIRNIVKTAFPILVASIFMNTEWAILGVFAASMGTKEVGAWSIISYVWGIIESLTEGIGDAAEIQVALHLGKNDANRAKLAAYKSLFIGLLESFVVFAVFIIFLPKIPSIFTPDETLQESIMNVLPYLALGYINLTFGDISWYIVGATDRYSLGTYIHIMISWGIIIPLAALFVYWYNFDLQGICASLVLGYTIIGCCMSFVLFTTNWKERAGVISKENEEDDESDGSTDDSEEHLEEMSDGEEGNCASVISSEDSGDSINDPEPNYDEYDWDELPKKALEAAKTLGYTKRKWNSDRDPELVAESDWKDLTEEEQKAAKVLGFNEGNWDED